MTNRSSRHWYPRYPGDYARKTSHLSLAQHGAYALLMDWYYSNSKALPNDWVQLHRICKAVALDEQLAVQSVVSEFFILRDDGWHNERADSEIVKKEDISSKRRVAQSIREKNRYARNVQNECITDANAHTSTSTLLKENNIKEKGQYHGTKYPTKAERVDAALARARTIADATENGDKKHAAITDQTKP